MTAAGTLQRINRCVLAALVLTIVAVTPAVAGTPDSIGMRLLDAPITDDPRARIYIVDHLAPGTVIERRVEVANTSDSAVHVALYPSAATIEDGTFQGAEGRSPNDLSTWTSVDPSSAEIPAGGTVTATVTIAVPDDAAPGEQYAAIWAEARIKPKDGGVVQVNRVGIRVYLSVGPGGAPAADFTIDSLTAQRTADGQPILLAEVHNTGGRALDISGVLRLLDGPSGLTAGPFPADLGTTLAIGDTGSVSVVLDEELPAGPWKAQITLESGLIERKAHAVITFPKSGAAAPVPTATDGPPWLLFGMGAAVVLFLLELLRRQKRHHRGALPPATVVS